MSTPAKGRPGGVLPISIAATKKPSNASTQSKAGPRAPAPKLRLIVRRLPPGLTETEFWSALGSEWQVGSGKIDWAAFKEGKVTKDLSKPSRPGRAYLKVKDQALIDSLALKVRTTGFQDARNTSKDSCLIGPPNLEYAPYNKIPSNRTRHDGRQGTIDQDQEFIDFLQSLTEPITKPAINGVDSADVAPEKVTTTPLVQYLKEKKANKAKEAAEKKSKARQEKENAKAAKAEPKTTVVKASSSTAVEKARVAKATQDAVKAINKSVAAMQTGKAPAKEARQSSTSKDTTPPAAPAKRERERGNASAAARMLQRDLGLAPRSPRAARATATPSSPAATKVEPIASDSKQSPASPITKPATPASPVPPTGPRASRATPAAPTAQTKPPPAPAARPPKPVAQPSAGAKSAFLKHANPSQGVTEDLLLSTFSQFGTVTRCEIDKRKGLGYVDFENTEGLRKAMAASPVKVGEKGGSVVVQENRNVAKQGKTTNLAQAAAKEGIATVSTSGTNASVNDRPASSASEVAAAKPSQSPSISNVTASTASPSVPDTTPIATAPTDTVQHSSSPAPPTSPTSAPAAPTGPSSRAPPSAPRANIRGGRGGGAPASVRGNFGPGSRGAGGGGAGPRGGFRGRGNYRGSRGGGVGGQQQSAASANSTGTGQVSANTGGQAGGEGK